METHFGTDMLVPKSVWQFLFFCDPSYILYFFICYSLLFYIESYILYFRLLSAWLLLISTALFSVVYIYLFVMVTSSGVVTADDRIDYCYYISYIVSTLLFLVGSIFILHASYPEEMEKMLKLLMTMDVNNMTFTERYFTGTSILLTTWFFLFAT